MSGWDPDPWPNGRTITFQHPSGHQAKIQVLPSHPGEFPVQSSLSGRQAPTEAQASRILDEARDADLMRREAAASPWNPWD